MVKIEPANSSEDFASEFAFVAETLKWEPEKQVASLLSAISALHGQVISQKRIISMLQDMGFCGEP